MIRIPFFHEQGGAGTWQVSDGFRTIMDGIPTELAAENVAREMNNAYTRGYRAAQDEIKTVLGIRQ